jgi:hypothetical protein
MLEPEIAALRDILLNGVNVTNSEVQATRWAREIIEQMYQAGYSVEAIDAGAGDQVRQKAKLVLEAWDQSNAALGWPFADALANLREVLGQ